MYYNIQLLCCIVLLLCIHSGPRYKSINKSTLRRTDEYSREKAIGRHLRKGHAVVIGEVGSGRRRIVVGTLGADSNVTVRVGTEAALGTLFASDFELTGRPSRGTGEVELDIEVTGTYLESFRFHVGVTSVLAGSRF